MTTLSCPHCHQEIELTQALTQDIERKVLDAEHTKHQAELERARAEAAQEAKQAAEATLVSAQRENAAALELTKKQLAGEIALLKQQADADLEITKKQLAAEAASAQRKAASDQEILITSLRADAEQAKADGQSLREQLSKLMTQLSESNKARENAEFEAQKKFAADEARLREEVTRQADERQRFNLAARDKTIADLQRSLDDAQRKAAQGSQQLQGEVLELDLEQHLREEFPYDDIQEVKKGARGADIKQLVRNPAGDTCGTILWETKNGKWQPAWVPKFKQDIREASANIGVIVSAEVPEGVGELKHLEANVWVASPSLATRLAAALRATILQVDAANKMSAGKDAKMESLYQFLVGPEFKHRIEAIIENYTLLQDELEKEKRSYALKWSRQEKAIRAVIDNTIGMYGDLQGITNRALPAIGSLELDTGDDTDSTAD